MVNWTGIGVGAQSTLGGQDIFARKICTKNLKEIFKMLNFTCLLHNQNIRMFMLFAR